MSSTAQLVVAIANTFRGITKGSAMHKVIVATFNQVKPQGYTAKITDAWCAETWTAWQIMAGNSMKEVPMSASCPRIITEAQALGEWIEDESVTPQIGWGVLYDWGDSKNYAKTDNQGSPDHIGIVTDIDSKYIYVLEGNKGNPSACGMRAVPINGQYLRGFVKPKYKALAKVSYRPTASYSGKMAGNDVKYGSQSDDVKALQSYLNYQLGYKLDADGKAGRATIQAVIDFQYTYGLDTDGGFGAKCRKEAQELVDAVVVAKPTAPKTYAYSGTFPTIPKKGYLGIGDSGTQVKNLQRFLNWYGSYGLSVDGSFGTKTQTAVKKFQKAVGITVDGFFGAKSLAKAKAVRK